jgi:hypothetical protein
VLGQRLLQLIQRVRGHAEFQTWETLAQLCYRKIRLANVYTVAFCKDRQIGPVVGEQLRTGSACKRAKRPQKLECLART